MSIDAAIAERASARHGVITRAEAGALGCTDDAIAVRVASGRWIRRASGVYVLAGSTPTFEQRVMVACACSTDAACSHVTAGRLRRLGYLADDERVHVTVGPTGSPRRGSAVVHRSRDLDTGDVSLVDGIPVTSIPRTIIDLAGTTFSGRLAWIVDDALDRRLVTWDELADCLARHERRGRKGIPSIRAALIARGGGLEVTQSKFERRFVAFCQLHALPAPAIQQPLGWRDRVVGLSDVTFPDERVIVELDGRRGHTQLGDMERDRVRDQQASAAGWQTLRVTWDQFRYGADALAERVAAVLLRRRHDLRS